MGKWWWKFMSDPSWCGADVIQFNYGVSRWNMFPRKEGRISFFWKGLMSCLPALRCCILHGINSGRETLLWKDRWLNGRAPMFLWSKEFRRTQSPNGTVRKLSLLLAQTTLSDDVDFSTYGELLRSPVGELGDKKWWRLTGKGSFSVKSFYTFLNDGELCCPIAKFF